MNKWIIKEVTDYPDGPKGCIHYFKGCYAGFCEWTSRMDDAKTFKTKKEAADIAKAFSHCSNCRTVTVIRAD